MPDRRSISFVINGTQRSAEVDTRMTLVDFLRHELTLTGTHVGCEHGVCGACTVQIDGAPARACLTLAVQADGTAIRTVEGLSEPAAFPCCRKPSAAITRCNAASARPAF